MIMSLKGQEPDIDLAWQLLEEYVALSPGQVRLLYGAAGLQVPDEKDSKNNKKIDS